MHLTIGIATWNRADLLAETLASLGSLRVPQGVTWDVLVCDNNSTDHTRRVVEEAAAFAGCGASLRNKPGLASVRHLFEPTQGKSHALNHLLREARGDWLLLLDDDVLVDENWLCAYIEGMARYPNAAVLGGAVRPRLTTTLTRRQQFLLDAYPSAFGVLNFSVDTPITMRTLTPGGANMAVRLDAARTISYDTKAGMFPGVRVAGEDATMALRIVERGHEGWMLAAAKVLHWTPVNTLNHKQIWHWQKGIGRSWILERGKPTPGKLGVPWWAWREMVRRYTRAMIRWRPWPDRRYCDAMIEAAQYWGYLTGK